MNERCAACWIPTPSNAALRGVDGQELTLDFCTVCGEDLCPACMDRGHCGHSPARSGAAEGYDGEVA